MSKLKALKEGKEQEAKIVRDYSNIEELLAQTAKIFPYFSRIIFAFKLVEKEDDPLFRTFAVDRRMRLYYNPKMFDILKKDELVACMFHEINHIIRGHIVRRGQTLEDKLNSEIWNIAEDLEINSNMAKDKDLGVEGQNLPKFTVLPTRSHMVDRSGKPVDFLKTDPSSYKEGDLTPVPFLDKNKKVFPEDKTCEVYYELLMESSPKIQINLLAPGAGGCGSCSGSSREGEEEFEGDKEDEDNENGMSEEMQEFLRKAVAEDVVKHVNEQKPGKVPGNILRWANKYLKPKVDWRRHLRASLVNTYNSVAAGMTDYTYSRRARKQSVHEDFIMPGFFSPKPKIGVLIDTSGSVSDSMLNQAISEVNEVLRITNSKVLVCMVDAAVHQFAEVGHISQIKPSGRGGTDMRVGYDKFKEHKPKPNILVCITDGFTPWPSEKIPGTTNIIVMTIKNYPKEGNPSWAKILEAFVEGED